MAYWRNDRTAGGRKASEVHSETPVFGTGACKAPETHPRRATYAALTLHTRAANAQVGKADPIGDAPSMRHIGAEIERGCDCGQTRWEKGVHPQGGTRKYPTLVAETLGEGHFETWSLAGLVLPAARVRGWAYATLARPTPLRPRYGFAEPGLAAPPAYGRGIS